MSQAKKLVETAVNKIYINGKLFDKSDAKISVYDHGLEIVTAATVRVAPNALSPRVKSLNYLNNIMAKVEGLQAGCVEALMLNHKGEIAECTGDNIFLVKNGTLRTPPLDAGILA